MPDPKPNQPNRRRSAEPTLSVGASHGVRDPAPPQTPDHIGEYRVLSKLGEGGMAVVFEAEQQNPRRRVALKVVRGDVFLDETQIKMFQREAEVLARLKHPGIAAIYESGRTEGGRPFFAMELVRGRTLHDYLEDRPQPDTRAELKHRFEMFREICGAVSYAHQRGVIHRDLKPSNVIVTDARGDDSSPSGHLPEIKILDFGLARLTDSDMQASAMTEIGVIKGTLPYMSPEQIRGDPREIDLRSDVYSLGVILYEMLTGSRPYDTRDKSMLEAARVICEEAPTPLRESWSGVYRLDGDIETITGRALEKDADRRYASADAIAEDVSRYLHSQPILARRPSSVYQFKKFSQRHRGIVWSVALVLLAIIVGAITSTTLAVRQTRRAEELQHFAYRTLIGSSSEAIERGDRQQARDLLLSERVPAALRGWEWHQLWAEAQPSGVTIAAPVVSESPAWAEFDGDELVYLLDGSGYRFDVTSGERLDSWSLGLEARPEFPESPLWIEHGPGGFTAAIVDAEGTRRLHLFRPDGAPCGAIDDVPFASFGPAGSQLARFGQPGSNRVVVWDLARCSERRSLKWDWWLSRSLSPDGSRLSLYKAGYSGNWGVTQIHDIATGRIVTRFRVPSEPTAEAFTPDGKTLISATQEGDLRIFGLDPYFEKPSIAAHDGLIFALAVSSDGRWVATAADDRAIRLWELSTGKRLAEFQVAGRTRLLRFAPDNRRLVRIDDDNAVTILDTGERSDPRRLSGHESYVYAAAVHPDGRLIATGDWAGVVLLWDAYSGRQVARLAEVEGGIHAFRFSPDGTRLIGIGAAMHVWELATGERIATLDREGPAKGRESELPAAGTPLDDQARRILTDFRPDDATVEVWNLETGERLRRPLEGLPLGHESWVSADGRFVVEARVEGGKSTFLEVRKSDGALHLRLPTTGGRSWPFALSHGERRPLLVAPTTGESSELVQSGSVVGVWELSTGRKIGELRGHKREVLSVAFTPDDGRIVTGSRDGTIRVWDPERFEEIAHFKGHRLYVKELAFSPDGTMLISASGDGTARIWDRLPINDRMRAWREQEQARIEAGVVVSALVNELDDIESAVERLNADSSLSETVRREALRELLRRSIRRLAGEERDEEDGQFFFMPDS